MATFVSRSSLKTASGLNVLFGLWLFLSPWIFNASANPDAWNSWITGSLIILFAALRYANPASGRGLSVMNMLFGGWIVLSPWIFAYTANTGRFVNSLIVGAAIFCLGAYGATSKAVSTVRPPEARM